MPRPRKRRTCRRYDGDRIFKPRGVPMDRPTPIRLRLDELEAMRLCDLEDCDQAGAGRRMGVSRGTIQRLLASGRSKVVHALVGSRVLIIEEDSSHEIARPHAG